MQLHQRLAELIGHEVFLTAGDARVPMGTLAEVGEDYLLIRSKDEEQGGYAEVGADWWVRMAEMRSLTHPSDCATCAAKSVTSP
jgi:hypothetical protein